MAWNQPGGDPTGKRRIAPPKPVLASWRRWQQRWRGNRKLRAAWYAAGAAVLVGLWLASGLYQVDDGQQGVVERFGSFAGTRGPGLGWHLPWPIESLTRVDLGRLNSAEFQSRMFTADTALVNIAGTIQYQIRDARAALYALRDAGEAVRALAEAMTRELVAARRLDELLDGQARQPLLEVLRAQMQQRLDALGAGVRVANANMTDVQVPEPVLAAQRDSVQALEDRERVVREAQGYASELLPRAQAQAQHQRLDAEADKLQAIGRAEGDVARFEPLLAAYEHAPELTRSRLYIETVETILARSRKIVIDGKGGGNTIYLPLDKFLDASTTHATGVTGIIEPGASSGRAPSAAAATTGTNTPSVPAAAPAGSDAGARDVRNRERGEP